VTTIELQNIEGAEHLGPVVIPADGILYYGPVSRLIFIGEYSTPQTLPTPFYKNLEALEITLKGGDKVYAADVAANRIVLDINKLD
jgi:hypothetical protein